MATHERKNLGIEGAIKIPDSDYWLCPGSIWNKRKTVIKGDPEIDESEFEILTKNGKQVLDEKGLVQEVPRRRRLSNPKDVKFFEEEGVKVYPNFPELELLGGESGTLYVDKDGTIHDPAKDTWMENQFHDIVRDHGGVFVNDTYMYLWRKRKGLLFLDGSYGSGKTTWAITHLLLICLNSKKDTFNCFYGMQEKERARQLHKNIITEIKRNHWEQYFKYSEADTTSCNIHCNKNGGLFQLFGCDDEKTIKGWNNPTHILIDEVNHVSFKAFGMLQSRLRRPGVETLLIACFNACDVIPVDRDEDGSWLWRYIFKEDSGSAEDKAKRKIFSSMGVTKHHSDFIDNYIQNRYTYWNTLVLQAGLDMNLATRYANGDWGTKLNAQLYYNRFDHNKHTFDDLEYIKTKKIINGWDENTQPYQPSLIAQIHGTEIWFLKEYLGYNPENNVTGVSKMIIKDWGGNWNIDGEVGSGCDHRAGWEINGDATSKKENSALEKGQNYFTIIQTALKKFKPEIRVQDANPNNKTRGEFLNLIFHAELFGIKIRISRQGCPKLIEDLQNVMQDIKNEKKSGHKDKSTKIVNGVRQVQPYGHLGDTMDYMVCENFPMEYLTFQNGDMTIDVVGGSRAIRNSWEKGQTKKDDSDQVKKNKKYRGDTKYGQVEEDEILEDEEVVDIPKIKSRNSW